MIALIQLYQETNDTVPNNGSGYDFPISDNLNDDTKHQMIFKIAVGLMLLSFFVPINSRYIPVQILAILCQWAWYVFAVATLVWMVRRAFL